mmetsp:Transcript_28645/g.85588  ORF Transcript_28645/g.85588 Transcript_28645/m.85588 type:complete len:142 (-) Transcript_28645:27-452(-)
MAQTRSAKAKAKGALVDLAVKLLCAPWVLLGPANIFKVAYVNRGSPVAAYIVAGDAEVCQANCKIARMWACLFWGLQTVVAAAVLQGAIADGAAAAAKLYVGAALAVAYLNDVVREPVAAAACVEAAVGLLLLRRAKQKVA